MSERRVAGTDISTLLHMLEAFSVEDVSLIDLSGQRVIGRGIPIGRVHCVSGKLVACDPLAITNATEPFAISIPTGQHEVVASVATYGPAERRIARVLVRFSNELPVAAQMAVLPDQDPATLTDGEYFGYGVDSGTGCFFDALALDYLRPPNLDLSRFRSSADLARTLFNQALQGNPYTTRLDAKLRRRRKEGITWAAMDLPVSTRVNIVAFSTGLGDGVYPTYLGLSTEGVPVCIITDFQILR